MKNESEKKIQAIVYALIQKNIKKISFLKEVSVIGENSRFFEDLGFDSVALVHLALEFEESFQIEIDDSWFFAENLTLGLLIQEIDKAKSKIGSPFIKDNEIIKQAS